MPYTILGQLLLVGLFFIILCHFTGKLILTGNVRTLYSAYNGTFILTGLLAFSCFFALLKTKGNTIFIITIPLFLLFRSSFQNEVGSLSSRKSSFIPIKEILLYYILSFSVITLLFSNLIGKDWIAQPDQDYIFYIDVAESLKYNGAENLKAQLNFIEDYSKSREPYHYFELWLAAGLSWLFNIPVYFVFLISIHALILCTSILLVLDLFKTINIPNKWIYFAPLLLLIKPVYTFPFLNNIESYTHSIIPNIKYQAIQVFLLGFVVLWYLNHKTAFYFLLFLPVVNITLLPATLGVTAGIALMKILKRDYSTLIKICVGILALIIIYACYYYFNSYFSSNHSVIVEKVDLFADYKTRVNIVVGGVLQLIIVFLPLFLVIGCLIFTFQISLNSLFTKEFLQLVFIICLGISSGILAWALTYKTTDSVQFFMNFAVLGISVILILLLSHFIKLISLSTNNYFRVAILLLPFVVLGILTKKDNVFIVPKKKLSKEFASKFISGVDQRLFSFLKAKEEYSSVFSVNDKYTWPGGALKFYKSDISGVSLSTQEALKNTWDTLTHKRIVNLVEQSPFVSYMRGKRITIDDTIKVRVEQKSFQKVNHLKDLISKHEVRDSSYELVAKDPYSGYYYYKLVEK